MDAAAALAKAAFACFEVVANLVEFHNRARLAGLASGRIGVGDRTVDEPAVLAALTLSLVAESVALANGSWLALARGTTLTLVARFSVGELAVFAALTLSRVAESVAFANGSRLALTQGTTLTLAAAARFDFAVSELAVFTALAVAGITPGEADALSTGLALAAATRPGFAFVLTNTFVAIGTPSTEEVAADLLAAVVSASVIGPMAETASVTVHALSVVTPVKALAAFTTLRLSDGFALRVLKLAIFSETASAGIAERSAHLNFALVSHLK